MPALPRLVATDLDGTPLRSDGTVGDRARAALLAVEEAGVIVVFVSGRPLRWMQPSYLSTSWAGTSYAMGNAHPVVRDAATRVTSTNDEQGVAMVLESLLAGAADAG